MKQQDRARKQVDKKISRDWSVHPAVSANGRYPMIELRLGTAVFCLHQNMATHLANALVDCTETQESTEYRKATTNGKTETRPRIQEEEKNQRGQ